SGARRARISASELIRCGLRCWATTIGAGNSAGNPETSAESASIPPAEAPTTTSWGNCLESDVCSAIAATPYPNHDCRPDWFDVDEGILPRPPHPEIGEGANAARS